jgi:poly(3-hydroxybutyrate) depolymerase
MSSVSCSCARSLALVAECLVSVLLSGCKGESADPASLTDAGDAGCSVPAFAEGDDPCTAPLAPGSDRLCTFEYGGKTREFLLYAPPSFNPCAPTALVVDAHGAGSTMHQQAGLERFGVWPEGLGSGWRLVADREGFVVVTPQGIGDRWQPSYDVGFLAKVESMVSAVADVDPARVFLTGTSNGGFLSYATACDGAGAVFRGFAPVAAGHSGRTCVTSNRAPLIGFHAPTDEIVRYDDGKEAAALWAKTNGCAADAKTSMTFGGPDTDERPVCLGSGPGFTPPWSLVPCRASSPVSTCQTWEGCDHGGKVTFCSVEGSAQLVGGHILYVNDTRLSLAAVAWDYFKQFSR